jgi:hypothetical protein
MITNNVVSGTSEQEIETGKKTSMMLKYESDHNLKLEQIIPLYYQKFGSLEATAEALQVNINTLYNWMLRLGITIKKTLSK